MLMSLRINIQPFYVIAATAIIAILMVGSALIELRQSREELYSLLREDAVSLAETIDQGGSNAIRSMDRIEDLLAQRLLDNGHHVARLDSAGSLRPGDLASIARTNNIYRINIFNRRGTKIMSSHSADDLHATMPEKYSPDEVLAPLLREGMDHLVIGFKEARVEEGQRFAVAVRRTHPAGGAIVLNIDAQDLLAFRRSIGIGKLIRDLGDNSGVSYVALQDTAGILAASGSVKELSSFASDSVLRQAIDSDATLTRVAGFNGTDVFEVIRPFAPGDTPTGVLRIGLMMDEVRDAEARMSRRMIIMSLIVIVIGALAVIFMMAQQNSRLMEKKYSSMKTFTGKILAEMGDGVVTVDHAGAVTIFNPRAAQILGLQVDAVEGRRLLDIDPGGGAHLGEIFALSDGSSEVVLMLTGGMQGTLAVSLSTTYDATGARESRTAVIRDLTDARRLEREAQRKEKLVAMGELASGVAHEIRNPLNAMAMIAQRFSREFTPRKGVREFRTLTQVLQQEARRVNAIVQQFLSFARPPKLQRHSIVVADLIEHVASLFSTQAREKGVGFSFSTHGNPVSSLDREQMTQALLNLLQNALDATPPAGEVTLTSRTIDRGICITVADTGAGIPSASLEKIFNLYYTTKPEGNGLGLSITQQIVAQHDGSIDVASTVGKGTVFTIDIPASSGA
jgi:two-component system, NtrC family, sensor histidine kinase HydH